MKNYDALRLVALHSADNGATWRANHAIVEPRSLDAVEDMRSRNLDNWKKKERRESERMRAEEGLLMTQHRAYERGRLAQLERRTKGGKPHSSDALALGFVSCTMQQKRNCRCQCKVHCSAKN